jgi:hypothetical protein
VYVNTFVGSLKNNNNTKNRWIHNQVLSKQIDNSDVSFIIPGHRTDCKILQLFIMIFKPICKILLPWPAVCWDFGNTQLDLATVILKVCFSTGVKGYFTSCKDNHSPQKFEGEKSCFYIARY